MNQKQQLYEIVIEFNLFLKENYIENNLIIKFCLS